MTTYEVSNELEDVIYFMTDGTAMVHKKSMLTGIMHKAHFSIDAEQMIAWKQKRELIQDVFLNLSSEEREFLMTGATPEEWKEEFGNESDD